MELDNGYGLGLQNVDGDGIPNYEDEDFVRPLVSSTVEVIRGRSTSIGRPTLILHHSK
jgi:hypothetical protein